MALLRALLLASVVALGASRSNPAVEAHAHSREEGAALAAHLLSAAAVRYDAQSRRETPDLSSEHLASDHARRLEVRQRTRARARLSRSRSSS